MMSYVVDASAAVEYLLRTRLGRKIAEIVDEADLLAPALMDVEVVSVLRRAVLDKGLAESRAALALDDLVAWPVGRIATRATGPRGLASSPQRERLRRLLYRRSASLRRAVVDGGRTAIANTWRGRSSAQCAHRLMNDGFK